ncbi:MFS transporter permease [Phenylobacterium sp. 58.2.17]|uniref:MFS transporter permease n=1 Tax=Phenylobacterium sp. 58.2.17 TaxID=2969306 RepID=UPI0022650DB4|nr:MFS transporter permease [Phenylobacterium sp. 58.2.17]MCX7587807.1 MFS transporter permease [Phenylobacterium sp. 58.2.17]
MPDGMGHKRAGGADLAVGWGAVTAAGATLLAWAACCVLPLALSIAGVSMAGMVWIAGQRTWLTVATLVVLGIGWWAALRRGRACSAPSRLTIGLLSIATALTLIALAWQPLLEPRLLAILRTLR